MAAEEMVYYKKQVANTVVVRRSIHDNIGVSLNTVSPWIAIPADQLLDFKLANKKLILDGLIAPMEAPSVDWETPNTFSDEEINELLKNYLKLKNSLKSMDSASTLYRLLEAAKEQDKSEKVKKIIRARLDEVESGGNLSPQEMQGVGN